LAVPLFAFLEACVGIGLFITGVILLTICTVLYANGLATLPLMLPLAFMGALLGDHSGFWLGKFIGPSFHHSKFANRYKSKVVKVETLIIKRGYWAIFIGRLMPAIRSLIPLITGISGMSKSKYFVFDAVACLLWSSLLGVLVVGIDKVF